MAITIDIHISSSLLALLLVAANLLVLLLWRASSAEPRPDNGRAGGRGERAEHGRASVERVEEQPEERGEEPPEEPSVSAEAPEWVVISEPPFERYYFTLGGERVHTRRECWGLRNARKILSADAPEVLGKTRCKLCFLRE